MQVWEIKKAKTKNGRVQFSVVCGPETVSERWTWTGKNDPGAIFPPLQKIGKYWHPVFKVGIEVRRSLLKELLKYRGEEFGVETDVEPVEVDEESLPLAERKSQSKDWSLPNYVEEGENENTSNS